MSMGHVIAFPARTRPLAGPSAPRSGRVRGLVLVACWVVYLAGFFILAPTLAVVGLGSLLALHVALGTVCLLVLVPCLALTRVAWRRLPQQP
jgi:hypothetical protein